MQTAFDELIAGIPSDASVMDVGYGGLNGENTTNALRQRFQSVKGICKSEESVAKYKALCGSTDEVFIGEYPKDLVGKGKYDLLVVDPNLEGSLDFWSAQGMHTATSFLNKGGYVIAYMMLDLNYGGESAHLTQEHRNDFWVRMMNEGFYRHLELKIVDFKQEERRKEIIWFLLQLV